MSPIDIFTNLLKVNPTAGRFIAIGVMVLAAAAIVVSFGVAQDQLVRTALYVLAFSVAVLVLMNIPGLAVRAVGWVLTIGFILWSSALLAQTMSGNRLPWLAPVQCLVFVFSASCNVLQTEQPEAPPPVAPVQDDNVLDSIDRVYVQFAGSISRDEVVSFAHQLLQLGFPVQDADRGGERTGNAVGLNEVRYFHEADRQAAELLAAQASDITPTGSTIVVRHVTLQIFNIPETEGLLEVWISN